MKDKILVIGYGNPDRQDDGAAWHILVGLAKLLHRPIPNYPDDNFEPSGNNPELWFALQLVPEMSETIGSFDRVCFVDAHTGSIPVPISKTTLKPSFQTSPLTHHMTPTTCLELTETLYHQHPETILVSVRGYQFGFETELSLATKDLVDDATQIIWDWINAS